MQRVSIAFVLLPILLAGCAAGPPQVTGREPTAAEMYEQGHFMLERDAYDNAIDKFNTLQSRYPFSPYARQAQLEMIFMHYRLSQWESAISLADRFIRENPRHEDLPYVYYMKGLVNFTRSIGFLEDSFLDIDRVAMDPQHVRQAFQSFSLLAQRFPGSEYAPDARKRMIFLRNRLARHDLQIAEYYLRRGAFLAAANRADDILKRYQGSPVVAEALGVMARSYDRLGLPDKAEEARRVLQVSFPDRAQAILARAGTAS